MLIKLAAFLLIPAFVHSGLIHRSTENDHGLPDEPVEGPVVPVHHRRGEPVEGPVVPVHHWRSAPKNSSEILKFRTSLNGGRVATVGRTSNSSAVNGTGREQRGSTVVERVGELKEISINWKKNGGGSPQEYSDLFFDHILGVLEDTVNSYIDLLPLISGCLGSVAGCHVCVAFTYLDAGPRLVSQLCLGKCTAGVVGTCISLVTASINIILSYFIDDLSN